VIDTSIGRDRAIDTSRASIVSRTPESIGAVTSGTRNSPSPKNNVESP
jgi:hypothetical protein